MVPAASVVKVDDGTALDKAALVRPRGDHRLRQRGAHRGGQGGETVIVMGIGGIGINAVQGARIAWRGTSSRSTRSPSSARRPGVAVTHTASTVGEAALIVAELTRGQMADSFIVTTDVAESDYIGPALDTVAKRGKVVVTAVAHPASMEISGNLFMLTMMEKQIRGSLYGSSNAQHDIPRILDLYNKGLAQARRADHPGVRPGRR